MSIKARIAKTASRLLRYFLPWDEEEFQAFLAGPMTKSGNRVNEVSSLNISAIYSAITIIAGTIASLPRRIYKRLPDGGKIPAVDHPLFDRLYNKPNSSDMTAWSWIFSQIVHKYLWGNWYTYIKGDSYRNREFIPLLPDRTYLDLENTNKYITNIDGKETNILRRKMLHIPHFSFNGKTGFGVIHFARESLGISMALDEFAARFFSNGANNGGVVTYEGKMDEADLKRISADFNKKYSGLGKSHNTVFLGGKSPKFEKLDSDAEKAQALQSRQFSVVEVARWMNLPPHILKELSRATFSNIEQQSTELVMYSFLPLVTQIEQAMNLSFFDDEERKDYFVKFELKGLLRGDLAARTNFYTAMLDRGIFNGNDVLELEDMNPQPDGLGDIYMVPFNMQNKEAIKKVKTEPDPVRNNPSRIITDTRTKKRSANLRRKITNQLIPRFRNYGNEIVSFEVENIRALVKEHLTERDSSDFKTEITNFYRDEFRERITELAGPLINGYSGAIIPVSQDEINSEMDITSMMDEFEREYLNYFISRHINSSRGQILGLVKDNTDTDALIDEIILERMSEWEAKRPEKIVMRESIRAESAFARNVFLVCGISKLVSYSVGKSCPYCNALDGVVIGIEDSFLPAGEFQPEGADEPLTVSSPKKHPPYHDGCDCGINPEK